MEYGNGKWNWNVEYGNGKWNMEMENECGNGIWKLIEN